MTEYTGREWKDHLEDTSGKVIQEGTPLSAKNLNEMEQGIKQANVTAGAAQKAVQETGTEVTNIKKSVESVTTQLADTVKEVNGVKPTGGKITLPIPEIDTSKVRLKTEKIGENDVTEEFRQQMLGDTPLHAIPPNFGVTGLKVENDAIDSKKVDFIKKSNNLFNTKTSTTGYIIGTDGVVTASGTYTHSDYIEVKPSTNYFYYGFGSVALYDDNKKFISRAALTAVGAAHQTPQNCYYVRLNYQHTVMTYANVRMMNVGTSAIPYEDWSRDLATEVVVSSFKNDSIVNNHIVDKTIGIEKLEVVKRSTNLFDIATITERTNIALNGSLTAGSTYHLSDFIKVKPSFSYTANGFGYVGEFDKDKKFIKRLDIAHAGATFTTTKDTLYIRASYQYNNSLAGKGKSKINEGVISLPFEEFYNKFEPKFKLEPLNEVIEKSIDRIMLDLPINGVFSTDETYADYTNFTSVKANEVYNMFDSLMNSHPTYITKEIYGNDSVGNPIPVYYFTPSFPSSEIQTKTLKVLITCGVHGYEHMSTLAVYLLFKEMCEKWKENELLEALRFNVKFIIMPVANPSGWDAYTRHNINDVDINRNFPVGWFPEGRTNGTEPLSEIESQYIKRLFDNNKDIDLMLDFHNFHKSAGGRSFIWIPTPTALMQHMAQNLISRMTRKWKDEFNFIPEGEFIGYTSVGSDGTVSTYARSLGIKQAATFEICNIWQIDETSVPYDANVCKASVEALANWLLINIRELIK